MTRQGRKDSHSTLSIKQISDDIAHYDNTVRVVQHQNRNINVDTDLSRLVPIHALCQTFLVTYFDDRYWSCLAKHCNCTPGLIYLSIIASLILTSYNLQGFNLGGRHTLSPSWWYVPPPPGGMCPPTLEFCFFVCHSMGATKQVDCPLPSPLPKNLLSQVTQIAICLHWKPDWYCFYKVELDEAGITHGWDAVPTTLMI